MHISYEIAANLTQLNEQANCDFFLDPYFKVVAAVNVIKSFVVIAITLCKIARKLNNRLYARARTG